MTPVAFETQLRSDGFVEIERKRLEPRPANGEHGHHYTARGLIVGGAFTITCQGIEKTYRAGEIFEVAMGDLHCEAVGPEGAELIVGRKY